jgi:hypothetical protein
VAKRRILFVGEGDVVTAWFVRTIASSLPHGRPVTIINTIKETNRPQPLTRADGVCIQKLALAAFAFL